MVLASMTFMTQHGNINLHLRQIAIMISTWMDDMEEILWRIPQNYVLRKGNGVQGDIGGNIGGDIGVI